MHVMQKRTLNSELKECGDIENFYVTGEEKNGYDTFHSWIKV